MKRFIMIRGIKGILVSDPRSKIGDPKFLGKMKVRHQPYINFDDLFDNVEQTVELDERYRMNHTIRKAIRNGELELVAECIALNLSEAIDIMRLQ